MESTPSLFLTPHRRVTPRISTPSRLVPSREPLLGGLPVDHVPDVLEVLCLAVLVLEVVGVLPGIDTQDGLELSDDGVLVLLRANQHRHHPATSPSLLPERGSEG